MSETSQVAEKIRRGESLESMEMLRLTVHVITA